MRVVYLGNHDIGVRCLNELVIQGEDVVAVFALSKGYWEKISKVEREHVWYESLEDVARSHGLPLYTPDDINEPECVDLIRELRPDVLFSISWDQMLKRPILDIPKYGCFNLHYALLPEHRGHAPINWAIIHGYTKTGVTIHSMVEKADRGDIIGQREIDIGFHDSARDVYLRALEAGTEVFREVLSAIREHQVDPVRQRHSLATYNKRRTPDDGLINWWQSAFDIYNMVRGLTHPYPGAFTYFRGRKLFVWESRLYENTSRLGEPGRIVEGLQTDGIRVASGAGSLVLSSVQFEGEEEIDARTFFEAHHLSIGERFGGPGPSIPGGATTRSSDLESSILKSAADFLRMRDPVIGRSSGAQH